MRRHGGGRLQGLLPWGPLSPPLVIVCLAGRKGRCPGQTQRGHASLHPVSPQSFQEVPPALHPPKREHPGSTGMPALPETSPKLARPESRCLHVFVHNHHHHRADTGSAEAVREGGAGPPDFAAPGVCLWATQERAGKAEAAPGRSRSPTAVTF